ncbi:MAG: nucleotidyltransferase family protein [Pseudomonadota bacterium]
MSMPVLIPAAGLSSRMRGTDKLLLEVDGRPLLRRQIEIAQSVSADVCVALPPAPHPRYEAVPDGVSVVAVPDAAKGMSASVRALVTQVLDRASQAMILLADLPALTAADLRAVLDAADAHPDALIWRGATQDGAPGHPLVVSRKLFAEFQALRGDTGGAQVAKAHRDRTHLVALPGNRARLDLDTPEDWTAWRAGTQTHPPRA